MKIHFANVCTYNRSRFYLVPSWYCVCAHLYIDSVCDIRGETQIIMTLRRGNGISTPTDDIAYSPHGFLPNYKYSPSAFPSSCLLLTPPFHCNTAHHCKSLFTPYVYLSLISISLTHTLCLSGCLSVCLSVFPLWIDTVSSLHSAREATENWVLWSGKLHW